MIPPKHRPLVRLRNTTDMLLVISQVSKALDKAGADENFIQQFKKDALHDYKTLLLTCYEYVDIIDDFNTLI